MPETTLRSVDPPEFGAPTSRPTLPAGTYADRLAALESAAAAEGYDSFVVYGDREHAANLAYLTGYDPRFEEGVLVVDCDGDARPTLLVGNEGEAYAAESPVADRLDVQVYASLSLPGQDRSGVEGPVPALRRAGVSSGDAVGTAGWKPFVEGEVDDPATALDLPAFLADALRDLAGGRAKVHNANALLMDADGGLRRSVGVDQLAVFEHAACHTSAAVRRVVFGLEPGETEFEAARRMRPTGLPLSCHPMLSTGERASVGLPSPSDRTIERGDPFTTAYGVRGALNARAGVVAAGPEDLPAGAEGYLGSFVIPYFEAVAAWYERLEVGVAGGDLYDAVHDRLDGTAVGVALNPGHYINLEEWMDTPVYEGSDERLASGAPLQMDVIPTNDRAHWVSNVEDGVALADEELRERFADAYPGAWERVRARRAFVEDVLGIDLAPSVLPFSNLPAYLPPFLLSPERVLVRE